MVAAAERPFFATALLDVMSIRKKKDNGRRLMIGDDDSHPINKMRGGPTGSYLTCYFMMTCTEVRTETRVKSIWTTTHAIKRRKRGLSSLATLQGDTEEFAKPPVDLVATVPAAGWLLL